MRGTIAITDYKWYDLLRNQQGLEEAKFWKPSATRGFHADQFRRLSLNSELPATPSVGSVSLRDTPDCLFGWYGNASALAMGMIRDRRDLIKAFDTPDTCDNLVTMFRRNQPNSAVVLAMASGCNV
jgi:hypothetical protein